MKITDIEIRPLIMKLTDPYTIAYETIENAENMLLFIRTSSGLTGLGLAAPDLPVTGETMATVEDVTRRIIAPALHGRDPMRLTRLMTTLKRQIKDHPSALAMVDMALYDLLGKFAGLPVWKLLGGFRDRIRTSMTIGILDVAETVERAKTHVAEGFSCLKIKGGLDVDQDVERMIRVREAVGKKIQLRFDANQGYTSDQAERFVHEAEALADIQLIEQPTHRDDTRSLGRVTRRVSVPIMADESLMGLRDVYRLARRQRVDMVNIKLMKVGGIIEARQIHAVAHAADLKVMVGCMDEAQLGIAAGLHFALSSPNVQYADLDGHIGLSDDITEGAVLLKRGVLYPNPRPGFGLHLE